MSNTAEERRCARCGHYASNYRHFEHVSGHDCLTGCTPENHHICVLPPADAPAEEQQDTAREKFHRLADAYIDSHCHDLCGKNDGYYTTEMAFYEAFSEVMSRGLTCADCLRACERDAKEIGI